MGFERRLGTPPNLLGVTIIWRGESRAGVLGNLPKTTHVLSNPTSGSGCKQTLPKKLSEVEHRFEHPPLLTENDGACKFFGNILEVTYKDARPS
ncbi:MAG: hypothetical protein A3F82_04715 [Deltaproteobacteria bacterium RIFCSPLOWO2_12_FULL_44_12]|nr:MAG: hypothetical protein A2712_05765 [Deltaproteobacteria bacterium RIFCSPHIGHO2_01_FULL_43_49]OGQ16639.1 MAG: hypothetical protein A3D22_06890 [Deltaproteobacteria bacterium RIFCSPHIGHO2_02_FULL_44_53]OGQ29777.1 MAG: hypothetical protein A3D98_09555 [Deltaproteobacteria bacterium RIFCSPHIGHO2_12_FULL_44_21]OGQ33067.1 MAG: hypothetical protein A2979_03535 [Deltaproteobacteria bacterium RIFCSPLOWO2_01_FULL_45_74]OGQ42162.1 MAG: hypothetical protein A3I70_05840 [Deltaproteobacteria bacterium 